MAGLFSFVNNITTVSILFFIIGLILCVVELFEPGFGIAGIAGIISFLIGIFITAKSIFELFVMIAILLAILGIMATIGLIVMTKTGLSHKFVLKDQLNSKEGFNSSDDMKYFLGMTGKTLSVLRPAGLCDFNGIKLDVVSSGEFIEKDVEVKVIQVEGGRIVVRENK